MSKVSTPLRLQFLQGKLHEIFRPQANVAGDSRNQTISGKHAHHFPLFQNNSSPFHKNSSLPGPRLLQAQLMPPQRIHRTSEGLGLHRGRRRRFPGGRRLQRQQQALAVAAELRLQELRGVFEDAQVGEPSNLLKSKALKRFARETKWMEKESGLKKKKRLLSRNELGVCLYIFPYLSATSLISISPGDLDMRNIYWTPLWG